MVGPETNVEQLSRERVRPHIGQTENEKKKETKSAGRKAGLRRHAIIERRQKKRESMEHSCGLSKRKQNITRTNYMNETEKGGKEEMNSYANTKWGVSLSRGREKA